jgi:hypothetical protein
MKEMRSLEQLYKSIIEESLSSIVYHFTSMDALYNILKTNTIILSSAAGKNAEMSKTTSKKLYYLSTTRSKTNGYYKSMWDGENSPPTVCVELNGDSLNQKYSGHSIDYWNYNYNDTTVAVRKELEDRLFSDKPTIENALKYINSISIVLPHSFENKITYSDEIKYKGLGKTDSDIAKMKGNRILNLAPDGIKDSKLIFIILECKKKNIPIHFYIKLEDLRTGNSNKEIPIQTIVNILKPLPSKEEKDGSISQYGWKQKDNFTLLADLWFSESEKSLKYPEQSIKYIKNIIYKSDWLLDDFVSGLTADFHNMSFHPMQSRQFVRLVSIMQKYKLDIKKLLLIIIDKWKNILKITNN